MRLLLLVLIAALSIYLFSRKVDGFGMSWGQSSTYSLPSNNTVVDGFGMSPGTLDQLQSTSVRPLKGPYLLY